MSETTKRGRGRPAVGDVLAVRLPADQRAAVKRAGRDGEPEAETARRLLAIGAALEPADWPLIADALTARADAHKRSAGSRSLIGPRFADARKAHHEQAAHLAALADRIHQLDADKECARCGSKSGVWTDPKTWTCFGCGDEWTS